MGATLLTVALLGRPTTWTGDFRWVCWDSHYFFIPAVFLRNTHFLVKMLPLENHKLWEFSLENPKPSSYFCSCFFRCFAGLWFSRRCVAVFQRKTNFLVKKVPSRKSQTLRISFRKSNAGAPEQVGWTLDFLEMFLDIFWGRFLIFGFWFSRGRTP